MKPIFLAVVAISMTGCASNPTPEQLARFNTITVTAGAAAVNQAAADGLIEPKYSAGAKAAAAAALGVAGAIEAGVKQ